MSTRQKVLLGLGLYLGIVIVLAVAFGSAGRDESFQPTEEYRLQPWIELKIGGLDLSVNKAVLYLLLATGASVGAMVYVAGRMQAKPNRVQTMVESAYDLTYNNISRGNMDPATAAKWFPFVATLFFFIFFSNVIGYIPLPVNTEHPVNIFGIDFPAFAIYAATANISTPLVLTLVVFFSYQLQGIRRNGVVAYFRGWIPAGTPPKMRPLIFVIEVISQLVRIISLSVRLFANILAGHLLILFMGGGLVVLLGLAALGALTLPVAAAFFLFEIGLIATLQAFIFATLTSIYFGEATAGGH